MKKSNQKSSTKSIIKATDVKGLDPKRAGIDIGSSSIYVCVADSKGQQEIREYLTFTADLMNMAKWLKERGVISVAMESTGVYWIPVFELLETQGLEVLLVNAHHLKNVPNRKTDVKDCQWIQQLHSHGFLNGSFRPSDEFVRVRAYVRQRRSLFDLAGSHVQLMQKALVQMNIQLTLVLSDITGKTGLSIIRAIISGERDPSQLARLRDNRCHRSLNEIEAALKGTWREEHIFELRQAYEAYEFYHKQIIECEKAIEKLLLAMAPQEDVKQEGKIKVAIQKQEKKTYNRSPYHFDVAEQVQRIYNVDLTEIPGIDGNILLTILSEIGTDMSKWRTVKQFTSWLGLCPGSKISGGKILSSRTKASNNRVAYALRLAAQTLYRSQTALGAFFRRMRAKFGAPKAITALAHKLAKTIYMMLTHRISYKELGAHYYEEKYKERVLASLKRRAAEFGFQLVEKSVQESA